MEEENLGQRYPARLAKPPPLGQCLMETVLVIRSVSRPGLVKEGVLFLGVVISAGRLLENIDYIMHRCTFFSNLTGQLWYQSNQESFNMVHIKVFLDSLIILLKSMI